MTIKDMAAAGGLSLVLLTGCDQGGGKVALAELEERLEELHSKTADMQSLASKLRKDLGQLTESREQLEAVVDAARSETLQMQADSEAMAAAFTDYRAKYHEAILKRAPGLELGELNLGGVVLHGAKVKSLDAWEVSIGHSNGITRFELAQLPAELKELFGYDASVGTKPAPAMVAAPSLPAVTPPVPTPNSGAAAPVAAATPRPMAASVPSAAGAANNSSSSGKSGGKAPLNAITTFDGVGIGGAFGGGGGGGGSGSKIKGAKSPVPSNYKPIGSSFSGSTIERNAKK